GDDEYEVRPGAGEVAARRAEHELDLLCRLAEAGDPLGQIILPFRISDRDARALAHQVTREPRGRAPFPETDDRHAPALELVGGDLGVEQHGHRGLPRKASWVPYLPARSRPRKDQSSRPPQRVQVRAAAVARRPAARSSASFADQRSNTL